MSRKLVRFAFLAAWLVPTIAAAQEATHSPPSAMTLLWGVVATIVYGLVGILLAAIGYRVMQKMMPFSVKDELERDHNVAVGMILAAAVLGVCIIVAATISS